MDWKLEPNVGVGPLRFGMTPAEASRAIDEGAARSLHRDSGSSGHLFSDVLGIGIRIYYDFDRSLACVAVSPNGGPQVIYGEIATVGRVPSDLNSDLEGYAKTHGLELMTNTAGDFFIWEQGLFFGIERSGDLLLSRPRFMVKEWASDAEELPRSEWHC